MSEQRAPAPTPTGRSRATIVKVTALVVVALLVAATAWTLLQPSPADGEPVVGVIDVEVVDDAFDPPVIEIAAGETVTWTFAGAQQHNVVGDGWGDETPRRSGTISETFTEPGEYRYQCTLHGGMEGRIVVAR